MAATALFDSFYPAQEPLFTQIKRTLEKHTDELNRIANNFFSDSPSLTGRSVKQQIAKAENSQIKTLNSFINQLNTDIECYKKIISNLERELEEVRAKNKGSAHPKLIRMSAVPKAFNEITLPTRLPESVASMAQRIIRK